MAHKIYIYILMLAIGCAPVLAAAAKWDCSTYPDPIQVYLPGGTTSYSVTQFDSATDTFSEMWSFGTETASAPSTWMNAFGYNPADDKVYGIFEDASNTAYLCRIDATPNSQDCLCELTRPYGFSFNAGTITADGTFYMTQSGGSPHKLANIDNLVSPPSPAPVASLASCGETALGCTDCKGTDPTPFDVTAWALTAADMLAAYGQPTSCTSQCYMQLWTYNSGTGKMATWSPDSQDYLDMIDYEHGGTTYLISLGSFDATVMIVRLDSSGDHDGHAYSRAVIDWTGAPGGSSRSMGGFGAGFRYGTDLYFSSNAGSGIFQVDPTDLITTLDQIGADACDFNLAHVCSSNTGDAITVRYAFQAPGVTGYNDGFNCKNAINPLLVSPSPPPPSPSPPPPSPPPPSPSPPPPLSSTSTGTESPAPPPFSPASCEVWCNPWTCGDDSCMGCHVCADLHEGLLCQSFCNAYTCNHEMCKGCSECTPAALANRCLGWCNVYVCGLTPDCQGCGICQSPSTWCEGWCNSHTEHNKYCLGC